MTLICKLQDQERSHFVQDRGKASVHPHPQGYSNGDDLPKLIVVDDYDNLQQDGNRLLIVYDYTSLCRKIIFNSLS